METKIKLQKIGGSLAFIIPKVYCEHINTGDNMDIVISDEKGKYGKFIAIWNKGQTGGMRQ